MHPVDLIRGSSMVIRQNLNGVPDLSERLRAEANTNLQGSSKFYE